MRIIEPKTYRHTRASSARKPQFFRSKPAIVIAALLLVGVGLAARQWIFQDDTQPVVASAQDQAQEPSDTVSTTGASEPQPEDAAVPPDEPEPQIEQEPESEPEPSEQLVEQPSTPVQQPEVDLLTFADNDFKLFYDNLKQPGLDTVENPPFIYDNVAADERIQQIAEDRGYKLRSEPSVQLATVDGYPVQPAIVDPWLALKQAAAADGHTISIVSAYRSISHQRTLFTSRLQSAGATVEQVAAGTVDNKIDSVLVTSSIPGYSKHHTGYTIDILCAGWAFENFKNSPCNEWISANNFEMAKLHGFIPSYPPGATKQGPDPEAWEYVWVGVDLLTKR